MKHLREKVIAAILLVCMLVSQFTVTVIATDNEITVSSHNGLTPSGVNLVTDAIKTNIENYFDSNNIFMLPDSLSENDEISVIVMVDSRSLLEGYTSNKTGIRSFADYAATSEAESIVRNIRAKSDALTTLIDESGINYRFGERYDTVMSGFEVTIKAGDFNSLNKLLSSKATLVIGDVYEMCDTKVIENIVDVYETGIFNSSASKYQGDGVLVAVLDTGLDYTHTAFSESNFTTSKEAFTLSSISNIIGETRAAGFTKGLTANDVYISKKVPYSYDYADKDADVFPINSEHGTHVAGVIAGKDDVITGVAPNAQLAIMKVFSDHSEGAKTSWLIAALEDCVKLGVDVINMSLGSSCGFAREVDKQNLNEVYDSIKAAGISLVTAASNDNNSTQGSDKNGSTPLTKHPDSGTVGAPASYDASLAVASVDGVKTPYILFGNDIIYFNEATTSNTKKKSFVNDILKTVGGVDSYEFDYVTIPGIGRSSDYINEDSYYQGKIVLVKRGTITFEEKIRIALKEKGAAGIIVYNNVSGMISMSAGPDVGATCSVTQDDGEKLAAFPEGKIKIARDQAAGPFMSDFSSWGPTSDLQIRPEITGHGGEILSAVPGQAYDRLSGTSMACPNVAGATAIIRQYVKEGYFGDLSVNEATAVVNRLMMSTADIVLNKSGIPYAVRKQGAGLVNIGKATTSLVYLSTYGKNGEEMDKTKFELGDDKNKTGVYTLKFTINNFGDGEVSYLVDAIVETEGVNKIYTGHGDTTMTMDGYLLNGRTVTVKSVEGAGKQNGNKVSVDANGKATVTVEVKLSDADKAYMDKAFENGIYVEGFLTLTAESGTDINLNAPMLSFYGDWTQAPIFDEEYYDTNKDELNNGIDEDDKLKADAYATRVYGRIYSEYISTLGTYFFVQDPNSTPIPASKEHISLSNQEADRDSTINAIRSINAGLLRNVKELNIEITERNTEKVIFTKTIYNQRKSYSRGVNIYGSSIDIDFSVLEHDLKNNTQYDVTVTAFIDYGEKNEQNNKRNTFSFPLFIDFEAPVITGVKYRTEYDRTTKETSLYADISVYDNHYAMGMQIGQIVEAPKDSEYKLTLDTFGKYITPVYSSFNSTSTVTVELTDYVSRLKKSVGIKNNEYGIPDVDDGNNSFVAICYDYAMNSATYEIPVPDEVIYMCFENEQITMSPNEMLDIKNILTVYPADTWIEVFDYESSDTSVVDVVNQTIVAKASGRATITAVGYNNAGEEVKASVDVLVLGEGDEGYSGGYTEPSVNRFEITGYRAEKAYHSQGSDDRGAGTAGSVYDFGADLSLTMYPSEAVTLISRCDSYSPEDTEIVYSTGKSEIASVDENGRITANAKGSTVIFVNVKFKDKSTLYSARVNVTVKDPFNVQSTYLTSYKGNGGEVVIPADRGIVTIGSYAFSNYEYVDKDLENGDVIDEDDSFLLKQQEIGENTITKVVIPEGVTKIEPYAFAKLTALTEVVFPTTLTSIGINAFAGCTSLKVLSTKVGDTVNKNNIDYVKFINRSAFENCPIGEVSMKNAAAIGDNAFENCSLNYLELSSVTQSIGANAFSGNKSLTSVKFKAPKVKIGSYAFADCDKLTSININSAVISPFAFFGCKSLSDVTIGRDVAVIGEYAFADTGVSEFKLDNDNMNFKLSDDKKFILNKAGNGLVLAVPTFSGKANTLVLDDSITAIGNGAFANNKKLFKIVGKNVESVGDYAFEECSNLQAFESDKLEAIGEYSFAFTRLETAPFIENIKNIPEGAFSGAALTSVKIGNGTTVGNYAFSSMTALKEVTIGDNVTVGDYAFRCPVKLYNYESLGSLRLEYYNPYTYTVKDDEGNVVETNYYYAYDFSAGALSALNSLKIGENAVIGEGAFFGNCKLKEVELGKGAVIGKAAFYDNPSLVKIDLSGVISIGDAAFSGDRAIEISIKNNDIENIGYDKVYVDGDIVKKQILYTGFAASLENIDLSSVEELGLGVFAYNRALKSVKLGGKITSVPDSTFENCTSLESVELSDKITEIGDAAFISTSIKEFDLSNIDHIGFGAFAYSALQKTKLKENAEIGDLAFATCIKLNEVENLGLAKEIGANAFEYTAITSVTFKDTEYIGDHAFGESKLTDIAFDCPYLSDIGDNPFRGCDIKTFGKNTDVLINDVKVGTKLEESYDISDTVFVKDGVIYKKLANGKLELISYPKLKKDISYKVEDGTVRITAWAFADSDIRTVMLPISLRTIGDSAFYRCNNLKTVVFTSLEAPALEEQYDERHLSKENIPFSSRDSEDEGLNLSQFYMWNVGSNYTNFYYGRNFVDYIGRVPEDLVMIKPANGIRYDSVILSHYFKTVANGGNAPTEATLEVIALINALPKTVTLNDEQAVINCREAYDLLPSTEQQALVDNYSKLLEAENMISILKARQTPEVPDDKPNDDDNKNNSFGEFLKKNMTVIIICAASACVVAAGAVVVLLILIKKKNGIGETNETNGNYGNDTDADNGETEATDKQEEESTDADSDTAEEQ